MSPMEAMSWFREGGGYDLGEEMISGYNVQLVRNGGWMGPPEAFLSTNKELKTAADLKGMKIRGAGDGAEILSNMGASMVMMPAGEVFESMSRGVIDGFEVASPTLNWDLGLQEAADYLYLSGVRQPYEYNPFIINKQIWDGLPADLKAIIGEVNEAETIRAYDELIRKDLEAIANFQAYGTNVMRVPSAIEVAYLQTAKEFYAKKSAADPFIKKVLDSYWGWQGRVAEYWAKL